MAQTKKKLRKRISRTTLPKAQRVSREKRIAATAAKTSGAKVTFNKPLATTVEVYQDAAKQYRFRAKAKNGEIIAHGEGYSRKWSAARGGLRVSPSAELRFLNTAPAKP